MNIRYQIETLLGSPPSLAEMWPGKSHRSIPMSKSTKGGIRAAVQELRSFFPGELDVWYDKREFAILGCKTDGSNDCFKWAYGGMLSTKQAGDRDWVEERKFKFPDQPGEVAEVLARIFGFELK